MIGFGTAATGDASPLLFGNPHWYWRGPDRFYQAQLTIPGELNISGTSFLGIPVILIGFNDNIAWSHTVSTARRFGFFQLKLASGDPTSYMRDGAAVKMQPSEITVKVKGTDGATTQVTRTLYKSEYGPMVNLAPLNSGWRGARPWPSRSATSTARTTAPSATGCAGTRPGRSTSSLPSSARKPPFRGSTPWPWAAAAPRPGTRTSARCPTCRRPR
jgi:hypothetical protein